MKNKYIKFDKKRESILRIRPFNMANFSGAGGYIPMLAMFGSFFSFPGTLLLWTGLSLSLKKDNGKMNYIILKRRLFRIILPICLVSSIPWILFCIDQFSSYGSDLSSVLVAVWTSSVHSVGMFLPIYYSANYLNKRDNLTKGKWLALTFAFAFLMVIIGIAGTFLLMLV